MLPVLARFGPITIGTHDFFTVVGMLAGFALYYRALRRDHLLSPQITLISVAAVLGGALGARLITSWEILDDVNAAHLPLTYVLTHGPKSILGGLAGGYVAIVLTKRALGYTPRPATTTRPPSRSPWPSDGSAASSPSCRSEPRPPCHGA